MILKLNLSVYKCLTIKQFKNNSQIITIYTMINTTQLVISITSHTVVQHDKTVQRNNQFTLTSS